MGKFSISSDTGFTSTLSGENKTLWNNLYVTTGFSATSGYVEVNQYGEPRLMDTIVKDDCIELVYTETKLWSMSFGDVDKRVFKIVYSCKEGKWNKSEKIYGEIIPASEEKYEFE